MLYTVKEFSTPWPGRAFHLVKSGDSYDVFIPSNGQDHNCSCPGHAYGRGKPCKHVLACRALIEGELVKAPAPVKAPVAKPRDWSKIEAEFA